MTKIDSPFYEILSRNDSSDGRYLQIVRDAAGSAGGRFRWRDLSWAVEVNVAPPLELAIARPGRSQDYCRDIQGSVPVLSMRAAAALKPVVESDVEFIPAKIEGASEELVVINIRSSVVCVDENRTEYVRKWTGDSIRPDLVGEYKELWGLVIDPTAAKGHHIFRLWGAHTHIVVSQEVVNIFDVLNLTGAKFVDVSSAHWMK